MAKSYHSGYDYFTPKPGTEDKMQCRACGADMNVERDVEAGSRYAHIGHDFVKRKVDRFTCPHAGEKWHNQAIALKKLIRRTPSQAIAGLVEAELKTVIEKREPSKESWDNYG